jgi:hypothetical protein
MLIIFFDVKGTVQKQFVLAGQTVNSAYYCNVLRQLLENVRRLGPKLRQQKNWLLTAFSPRNFLLKQHDPHQPYFSLFHPLKIEIEGPVLVPVLEIMGGSLYVTQSLTGN